MDEPLLVRPAERRGDLRGQAEGLLRASGQRSSRLRRVSPSSRRHEEPRPRTSPTSSTGQMCGWPRADAVSASRRRRSPEAASGGTGRSSSATRLSSRRSRAL